MIAKPQPSLVINYYYLWKHEEAKGQENGIKNRPCLIVSTNECESATNVIVVPVTTVKPDITEAIEIPVKVLKHLGLDTDEPSYIICSEVNTFIWPGCDLAPIGKSEKFEYGFLPPLLFEEVKIKITDNKKAAGKLQIVSRSE